MALRRKKTFVLSREADKLGPHDERPMLPEAVDLQICLSRNDRPQPFFLICEKDTLLVVVSGTGKLEFRDTNIAYYPLVPADHVYVPGGAPTRMLPDSESLIVRYKARDAGLEGVAWYCEVCRRELHRHVFDTRVTHPQAGYLAGVAAFNDHEHHRRCRSCDAVHPIVDVSGYHWEQLGKS